MPDEFDTLSRLMVDLRSKARDAWRIANELHRDKMLTGDTTASLSDILREIASVEVDIDLARGGR